MPLFLSTEQAAKNIEQMLLSEFGAYFFFDITWRGNRICVRVYYINDDYEREIVTKESISRYFWQFETKNLIESLQACKKYRERKRVVLDKSKHMQATIEQMRNKLHPYRKDCVIDVCPVEDEIKLLVVFNYAPGVTYTLRSLFLLFPYEFDMEKLIQEIEKLQKEKIEIDRKIQPKKRILKTKIFFIPTSCKFQAQLNEFLNDLSTGKISGNPVVKEIHPVSIREDENIGIFVFSTMIIYEVDAEC